MTAVEVWSFSSRKISESDSLTLPLPCRCLSAVKQQDSDRLSAKNPRGGGDFSNARKRGSSGNGMTRLQVQETLSRSQSLTPSKIYKPCYKQRVRQGKPLNHAEE
jgi:hypothetical protein